MNYTPNDLQNIVLKKSMVGGYNEDMVNDILDKVIEDYTSYIHENIELKDKVAALNEAVQHYKNIEDSLQDTLIVAQQTGEDIKKNGYQKSENIIKEAEIKAQKIINEANQEVIRIKYEYEDMKKKFYVYKSKAEALLASQQEILRSIIDEQETSS
ncbi:DivIVA domain-containing protein [Herbivorax sp. ANBcel31]|uniref:DivIVA domain-containing protein n=1 Tax=Herbivorax sp. ANBcel31 TaxID=3069754 RepID=UPI0027B7B1C2|nr:DivIVA domain-containing protein [Herbivorax sp. ANBcel31]MDQ2086617.1 DivIVA domain-containing protein [Herbivorax sp. ANBcel31]